MKSLWTFGVSRIPQHLVSVRVNAVHSIKSLLSAHGKLARQETANPSNPIKNPEICYVLKGIHNDQLSSLIYFYRLVLRLYARS